ncbi:golgi apyrase, partial [Phenoliferia sp. Uapishka_3]
MVPRPASWSQGRQFGIVIDAGSSGSRVQVYSWIDPEIATQIKNAARENVEVLSKVEAGVEAGDGWHIKVEPGISTFGDNPAGVGDYLRPLIEFAASVIPTSQHKSTPIYLLATAGMRLLPPNQRQEVLLTTCAYLQSYKFLLPDCSENVRVITGEEEGLYGWIAVNYLMDGFDKHDHSLKGKEKEKARESSTYGFLDMGGASTQIAFEPSHDERVKHADNLLEVKLRLLSGREVRHPVFVTTWLGFGTNQARERYIDQEVKAHVRASDEAHVHGTDGLGSERPVVLVDDPCLPKSLMLSESRHAGYTLRGTGDFETCVRRTGPLLNKEVECLDEPCLFNGVHVPKIDFEVNHFIGISEYWYSTQDVWSMGGVYDFVEFERNAKEFCGREWDAIMDDHKKGAKWRSSVELSRLETQCFKAAWVINVLHEGIGIPRIIDRGGTGDKVNQTAKGINKAAEKGLLAKPPSFQSLNQVGDVAVSWTLGKMVLEVSKQAADRRPALNDDDKTRGKSRFPPFGSDWAGHIPAWSGDVRSTLANVKNADPVPIVSIAFLIAIIYFFCLSSSSSRRRKTFFGIGTGGSRRKADFAIIEEGGMSSGDSSSGSGSRSPPRGGRRPPTQSVLSRALSPVRYAAYFLSSTIRSWNRPRSSSLLPTSAAFSTSDDIHRPRPIRHTQSTPFMRSVNISTPSSTAGSTTTHWNDAPDLSAKLSSGPALMRSLSSSRLATSRPVSPPPMLNSVATTLSLSLSSSRPTTPAAGVRGSTPLSKLGATSRTRESSVDSDVVIAQSSSTLRRYPDTGTPPNEFAMGWESYQDGLGSPTGMPGLGANGVGVGAKLRASKSQVNLARRVPVSGEEG